MQLPSGEAFSVFIEDPEICIASSSGSITDVLVHPQRVKRFIPYLVKTILAGYLLATFVSPAVAEKFKLTKKEALAASFICGYAGVRMLNSLEKLAEEEIKKRISSRGQSMTTDSSNEDVS